MCTDSVLRLYTIPVLYWCWCPLYLEIGPVLYESWSRSYSGIRPVVFRHDPSLFGIGPGFFLEIIPVVCCWYWSLFILEIIPAYVVIDPFSLLVWSLVSSRNDPASFGYQICSCFGNDAGRKVVLISVLFWKASWINCGFVPSFMLASIPRVVFVWGVILV